MLGIKCIGFLWQKWWIIQAGTHLIVEHLTFLREECLSTKHVIDGFFKSVYTSPLVKPLLTENLLHSGTPVTSKYKGK